MAQLNFNAANVAPQEPISPVPAGVYLAHIVESDIKPLKSGQGRALALTFQVLQGPCTNRRIFANLNVEHRGSAEAERIAQSQLSALCHAVGVINLQDTTQLHMRPVMIRVKVRKDDSGQYQDRNEVTGYEAAQGAAAPATTPRTAAFPSPAAAQPAAPWARRPATQGA